MLRKMIFTVMSAALLLGLIASPAAADTDRALAAKPTAVTSGNRVVVTIGGKKPSKAALVVSGKRYPLKRKGKVWRTKPLSAKVLAGFAGAKAKVKVTVGGKKKTLKTTISGNTTTPPVTPPPAGTAPLFAAPGVDRTGNEAWEAIKGYFLDSTFTSCPSAWPNCFSEERYGHFANYSQVYCRLTSAPGADITNYPKPMYVYTETAYQKADGAWGITYLFDYGDGKTRFYSWSVAADGSATGRYWYDIDNPNLSPPTEQISGLVWMRGAKDCSY